MTWLDLDAARSIFVVCSDDNIAFYAIANKRERQLTFSAARNSTSTDRKYLSAKHLELSYGKFNGIACHAYGGGAPNHGNVHHPLVLYYASCMPKATTAHVNSSFVLVPPNGCFICSRKNIPPPASHPDSRMPPPPAPTLQIWWAAYGVYSRAFVRALGNLPAPLPQDLTQQQRQVVGQAAAGFCTGMTTVVLTNPLDVLRTRLQVEGRRGDDRTLA